MNETDARRKSPRVNLTLKAQAVEVLETVPKRARSEYVSELIIDDGFERGLLDQTGTTAQEHADNPAKTKGTQS